jgi:hypothetical protein
MVLPTEPQHLTMSWMNNKVRTTGPVSKEASPVSGERSLQHQYIGVFYVGLLCSEGERFAPLYDIARSE